MSMRKGSKMSDESKQKMRLAKLGKPSNWKGRSPSKESREKMRLAKLGRKISLEERDKNRQSQYKRFKAKNPDYRPDTWLDLRRKRIKQQGGTHSAGEWETLKAQFNWTCPSCKKVEPEIKLTRDHIIPISRGGTDNIENIQPLCKPCNSKKHTQTIKY